MFNYEAEVNEIYFNTKYVSGRALDAITDFTNNTYIIKGSTGIGGTTALLNYTKGHCLIVSPNVGMIQSKELNRGKYDSAKQLFMYSNSKDQWKDWNDYSNIYDNIIISTTPNQLLKIRNENRTLYNDIIKIPVFIDEIHAFTVDSDYRIELGQFLELVYNEWEAVFKLSTATPNYNFLDVPTDKNVEFYKLIRENQPIKKIQLSSDLKDAKQFIQNQHLKGRLVICFTNNINFHKSFTGLRVKNLVGQTLDIKLKPYDRGLKLDEDLYEETDVIFLSSSYFAGFDILKDCSVCIISEQANEAYKINVNNVAQGYGRCRANIHDALFVNATAPYTKGKSCLVATPQITLNQVNKAIDRYSVEADYWNSTLDGITYYSEVSGYPQITRHLYINRAVILAPILNVVYDYQLYNEAVIYEVLERYGFEVSAYENEDESFVINENKIPFKSRIKNLIELDETQLYNSYLTTKHSLKFKEKGKYNTKLALEYLTAYLIKISNAEKLVKKLDNKRMRPNEYYKCMDLFLRVNSDTTFYHEQLSSQQQCSAKMLYKDDHTEEVLTAHIHMINDWQMLYASHKVTNNILSSEIEREIKLYELFYDYDLYQELNVDKNRIRNGKRAIIKRCKQQSILLDNDELEWLDEVIKSTYKALDDGGDLVFNNSRKVIKNKMTNALVYLLTNGHIYKFKEIKNREYNPLTQLPTKMRCIIPIKYVSVDLTSANAQIVDSILNTNNAMSVYTSLMSKRGISRSKAKKLYNSTLNNHRLTVSKACTIYKDSGYYLQRAKQLAKMTANVNKGKFYEVMTENEKQLIKTYRDILPFRSFRFHDALVLKYEDVVKYNAALPTNVKGYIYHVEFFNDSGPYESPTTDKENNGVMVENKFYLKAV